MPGYINVLAYFLAIYYILDLWQTILTTLSVSPAARLNVFTLFIYILISVGLD